MLDESSPTTLRKLVSVWLALEGAVGGGVAATSGSDISLPAQGEEGRDPDVLPDVLLL